jgi:hypothetical protein
MKLIFKTKELLEKLKNIAPTAEPKQTAYDTWEC